MSGPDWPGQLAAALVLLHNALVRESQLNGVPVPEQFMIDAREAVRAASASTGEQSDALSGAVCERRHVDDALVLTKGEAASQLRCHERTVGLMLATGRLHRVPGLGRLCRISRSEVEALAESWNDARGRSVVDTGSGRPDRSRSPLPVATPATDERAHLPVRAVPPSIRQESARER